MNSPIITPMPRTRTNSAGEYQDFGKRLDLAFKNSGITGTYAQVGKKFGVSATTIGNLLNGAKLPATALGIKLSEKTKVSFDWLMTGREVEGGTPISEVAPYTEVVSSVPVITLDRASEWHKIKSTRDLSPKTRRVLCPFEVGERAYVIEINDSLMEPRYQESSFVCIDPEVEPASGDDVVAQIPGKKPVFRRLEVTSSGTYLSALNRDYPERIEKAPSDSIIFGVSVGHWVDGRSK